MAAGEAISQSARQAQPELQKVYDSSLGEMNRREGNLRSELAKLGSGADAYKAGGLFTSTTAQNRTSGEKASALRELVGRRQDAVSGARYGAQQARQRGQSEAAKIQDKIVAVRSQRGAYEAGRVGDLLESQRGRANELAKARQQTSQSERNSLRSSGIDPDTGQPIPGGKLDPAAKKPKSREATPTQSEDLRDSVAKARGYASTLKQSGASRREAAALLLRGRNEQTITNDEAYRALAEGRSVRIGGRVIQAPVIDGKVDKTRARQLATKAVPAIPSFGELEASIALDLAYDGGISARNRSKLHGPGGATNPRYKLRDLGLPTARPKPRPKRTGKSVSGGGKNLGAKPFG